MIGARAKPGNSLRSANGDHLLCIAGGVYRGPKSLIRDVAAALDDDGNVGTVTRHCLKVAASFIAGDVEL